MRPRDWFSVGARLFGLWFFYRGFADLMAFGVYKLGLTQSSVAREFSDYGRPDLYYLWYATGYLTLAIYFVFFAEHLTRWAFRELAEADNGRDSEI